MRAAVLALAVIIAQPMFARDAPAAEPGVKAVASIAPVHSLIARVMQGAGPGDWTPHLLLPPGASPHDHALRPSGAAALERAALVFWIGPALEPWLERPLDRLARTARVIQLSDVSGLTRLAQREGAAFDIHEHGNASEYAVDDTDPHLWLDPANASLWLDTIAGALAEADPKNRVLYLANAAAARSELDAVAAEIDAMLAPVRGRPFVVLHDAFHYFEHRFDIEAAGAVALSDARMPGPARVARIRDRIREADAVCLFGEPQLRSTLVEAVAEGTGVRIGMLDPLGTRLKPGPGLYPALLRGLARGLLDCLR